MPCKKRFPRLPMLLQLWTASLHRYVQCCCIDGSHAVVRLAVETAMAFDWALMHDALVVCTLGCWLLLLAGANECNHMALLIGLLRVIMSGRSLLSSSAACLLLVSLRYFLSCLVQPVCNFCLGTCAGISLTSVFLNPHWQLFSASYAESCSAFCLGSLNCRRKR